MSDILLLLLNVYSVVCVCFVLFFLFSLYSSNLNWKIKQKIFMFLYCSVWWSWSPSVGEMRRVWSYCNWNYSNTFDFYWYSSQIIAHPQMSNLIFNFNCSSTIHSFNVLENDMVPGIDFDTVSLLVSEPPDDIWNQMNEFWEISTTAVN